jgi:hypothetical protein
VVVLEDLLVNRVGLLSVCRLSVLDNFEVLLLFLVKLNIDAMSLLFFDLLV